MKFWCDSEILSEMLSGLQELLCFVFCGKIEKMTNLTASLMIFCENPQMMIILGVICVIVLIVIIGKNPLVHIDLSLLSQWN